MKNIVLKRMLLLAIVFSCAILIVLLFMRENDEIKENDVTNYENSLNFTTQLVEENAFITKDSKFIDIDSLISFSPKLLIFFSQNDCEYCVHQLVYFVSKYVKKEDAIVIPVCSNVKALQFGKRNYKTEFEFYTTCPKDRNWSEKIHTPYIAVAKSGFSVNRILTYVANDTVLLKTFLKENMGE